MGNQPSCFLLMITRPSTAVFVGPDGGLRHVDTPARAAELMLQAPGHVVARAEELGRTRRVSGMRPEEQLRPGEVYLLLPAGRVGSRVSDRQMAVIIGAISYGSRSRSRTTKSVNGSGSGGRVYPEVAGEKTEAKLAPEGMVTGSPGYRTGSYRQWRPVLDTIYESH